MEIAVKGLEKSRDELREVIDKNMSLVETSIDGTRTLCERLRNYGIKEYDALLNLTLHLFIVQADLILFIERVRLSQRRFEKLLAARMLGMIAIEYLKDMNSMIGKDLVKELKANGYQKLVPKVKEVHKELSALRKLHEPVFTPMRNNVAAHKNPDSLQLINHMFSLDTDAVYKASFEIFMVNAKLDKILTDVYLGIAKEANKRKRHSPKKKKSR